uniref:Uncharacterized protein n=1 Tax=Timema monikensis TaxID=170555 RepID=A0A7R9EFJ3_9NEOP|nr:unnamed protein product [Timema monikensis]
MGEVLRLRRYLVNLSSKMVRTCIVMLVAVIFTGPAIDALKLPTYLRPCSRNDPNLNECILKVAREGAPSIIKGDRKYNIPVLNPLYIKELRVEDTSSTQTATLNIVLQDLYLHGLTEANIVAIKLDLKAKNLEIDLSLPTFFINFKYEINGKILVLPINGKGDGTLNLTNTNIQMHLDYDFVKKGDKTVYASVTGNKLDFSIGNLVVYLDNLFNGDKALGESLARTQCYVSYHAC